MKAIEIHASVRPDVAGPYSPIDRQYPIKVADAAAVIDVARTYWSHIVWRQHDQRMTRSMRYAAVAMGEVDEPDESVNAYDPMASAAMSGLWYVFDRIARLPIVHGRGGVPLIKWEVNNLAGAVVQLLFALLRDDDGLAAVARVQRTGYIGSLTDVDLANAVVVRSYVRALTRYADEFVRALEAGQYNIPLMSPYGYCPTDRRHYWTAPIEQPAIQYEDA